MRTDDSKKLEWLQRNAITIYVFDPDNGDASWWCIIYMNPDNIDAETLVAYGPTLREAIDIAMERHVKKEEQT